MLCGFAQAERGVISAQGLGVTVCAWLLAKAPGSVPKE